MSDKNNNLFSDDILKDLENLKSRYSDYGNDDEPIKKVVKSERPKAEPKEIRQKKPSAPAVKEKKADTPVRKAAPKKEAPAVKPAAPAAKPAPAAKTAPAIKPADDELSVFDGLILTDNGRSTLENNKPASASKAPKKASENKKAEELPESKKASNKTNKKKKGKKKSKKLLNTLLIVIIAVVLWGALFGIDLVMVSNWQDPVFCKKTAEYENGSKDYVGAFYKVQYHVEDNGDIYTVCLPWFVKGPNKDLEKANDKGEKKDEAATKAAPAAADNTSIEVTIPNEYIEEDTSEGIELTAEQKASGYISVAVNGDGSVTYQIGKADYERELQRIKKDTGDKLQGLVPDTDFPSIKKIEFNDDFSQVSLYVDKIVYQTGLDSFVNQSVVSWVGFYQSFAKQSLACDLSILDYTDGSVIEQSKG